MFTSMAVSLLLLQSSPVDAIVQKHMDKGLLGVGVAVVKDGKILHLKTYGKGATANNDDHYRLASITKQFTSGVIIRLMREGKIGLNDTLGKLMPDTPKAWHSVTVRHLLTHTSGIPSYTDSAMTPALAVKPISPDGIWQLVKDQKVDFAPGVKFKYNNTGYVLLGCIIERITKKDYYTAVDDYLLKPAGMKSTGSEKKFKVVESFNEEGKPSFALNMDWPYSAGALVSTLGDMAKWDIALRGTKVFTTAEKELMFNPDPWTVKSNDNYGYGWGTNYAGNDIYSYSHTGGIPGFSNIIERTIKGTTIIVLANHEYEGRGVLSNQLRDFFEPAPKTPGIADTMPELTEKHQNMFVGLLAGKCDESLFSAEFLKNVSPKMLIDGAQKLADGGTLSEFTLLKSEGDKDVRREYRVVAGQSKLHLTIAVRNGVIAGMFIKPLV